LIRDISSSANLTTRGNRLWCSSNLAPLCLLLLLPAIILLVAVQASPTAESAPSTMQDGVDFGPFLADVNRRVRRVWSPPKGTENVTVVVLFYLDANGQVSNVRLRQSCGIADADVAALNAIRSAARSGRFRPLPPGGHLPLECQFTFDQNTAGGAAIVSPDNVQGKVKIDSLKTAIEQMHGFSMRFKAGSRGDGRPDPEVLKRDEIAKVLRASGAESVLSLARELKSPDLSMRKNAVFELLELGGVVSSLPKIDIKAAVPALIEALNDTDYEVRIWSMAALGSLGPAAKEAIPTLKQATTDKDQGIRGSAKATIVEIETGRQGLLRWP